jgi:putative tributyrin esterase
MREYERKGDDMALLSVQLFSGALAMATSVQVILPDRQRASDFDGSYGVPRRGPIKALYLLHGMGDDQTIWCRRTAIERYASAYNLAVIMPTTGLHWYTNVPGGQRWWNYVSRELPLLMADFFPQISQAPEHTFAAGLSMGGYGALKLGLRGGGRFSHVASLSGAVNIARDHEDPRNPVGAAFFRTIFGGNEERPARSTIFSRRRAAKKRDRPKFTCGAAPRTFCTPKRMMRDHLNALVTT